MKTTITHENVIKLLKAHGIYASMDTEAKNGQLVRGTSFYCTFGIEGYYDLESVKTWLGY